MNTFLESSPKQTPSPTPSQPSNSGVLKSLAAATALATMMSISPPAEAEEHHAGGVSLLLGWAFAEKYGRDENAFMNGISIDPHLGRYFNINAEGKIIFPGAYQGIYDNAEGEIDLTVGPVFPLGQRVELAPVNLGVGFYTDGRDWEPQAMWHAELDVKLGPVAIPIQGDIGVVITRRNELHVKNGTFMTGIKFLF